MLVKHDDAYWNDRIDEIMCCFDFEKVKRCMDALEWSWFTTKGVPELWEIKQHALQQLRECVSRGYGYTGSGGFEIEMNREDGYLILRFCVDSCESYEG